MVLKSEKEMNKCAAITYFVQGFGSSKMRIYFIPKRKKNEGVL